MDIREKIQRAAQATGYFFRRVAHYTFVVPGRELADLYHLLHGFSSDAWARLKQAVGPLAQKARLRAIKASNRIASGILRLRILHQSSPRYRSFVYMFSTALAVSVLLALAFILDPGRAKSNETVDGAAGGAPSDTVEALSGEPEFPDDIFSDETLEEEPLRPESSAALPGGADDERQRVDHEAREELRRDQEFLRQEINRLVEEAKTRDRENQRNRERLDRYEAELERLRKQESRGQ